MKKVLKFIVMFVLISVCININIPKVNAYDYSGSRYIITETRPTAYTGTPEPQYDFYRIGEEVDLSDVTSRAGLFDRETRSFVSDAVINVEFSDESVISIENGKIIPKSEGVCDIRYTCEYNGETYVFDKDLFESDRRENERVYDVGYYILNRSACVGNSNDYIEFNERSLSSKYYVVADKLKLSLNDNKKTDEVKIVIRAFPYYMYLTDASDFPDNIMPWEYLTYSWKIEDESIAKIDEISESEPPGAWGEDYILNDSFVTITALKKGKTKLICTITMPDRDDAITKTIDIDVDFAEPENEQENNEEKESSDKSSSEKKDDTVAPTPHPQTGEGYGVMLVIAGLFVIAVVTYKKMKS